MAIDVQILSDLLPSFVGRPPVIAELQIPPVKELYVCVDCGGQRSYGSALRCRGCFRKRIIANHARRVERKVQVEARKVERVARRDDVMRRKRVSLNARIKGTRNLTIESTIADKKELNPEQHLILKEAIKPIQPTKKLIPLVQTRKANAEAEPFEQPVTSVFTSLLSGKFLRGPQQRGRRG